MIHHGAASFQEHTATRRFDGESSLTFLDACELFFVCGLVACIVVPFVNLYGRPGILSHAFFLGWIGTRLARGLSRPDILSTLTSPQLILFVMWILVLIFNAALERGPAGFRHAKFMVYPISFYFAARTYGHLNRPIYRCILIFTIIVAGLQALYSIPTLYSQEGIARVMMHEVTHEFQMNYARNGIGGYDLYGSLAVLLPLMWAYSLTRERRIAALVSGGASSIILLSIVLSSFFAATAVALVGSGLVVTRYLVSSKDGLFLKKVALGGFVVLVVSGVVFPVLLESESFDFVLEKANQLMVGVLERGAMDGERTGRIRMIAGTFSVWFDAPVFGVGGYVGVDVVDSPIGGHSSWVDTLAQYGIVGGGIFFALMVSLGLRIRRLLRGLEPSLLRTGIQVALTCYLVFGLMNTVLYQRIFDFVALFLLAGAAENAHLIAGSFDGRHEQNRFYTTERFRRFEVAERQVPKEEFQGTEYH